MFYDMYAALCKSKGISLSRAADEIGLSNSTVTKWKKTGATPSGDTLTKVAAYFGVSVDDLISDAQTEVGMQDQLIAFYGKVKDHLTEDDIDDIVPVSKGGLTTEDNLQTLCWRCNRSKSNKTV